MKIINQQTSGRNVIFAIGLIIGWSVATLPSLHATVIPLTGGDPGEGFIPTNGLKYAYRLYGGAPTGVAPDPGPVTIQGVTFRSFNLFTPPAGFSTPSTFALSWSYDNGVSPINIGASANDNALESMHTDGMYYYGHISGSDSSVASLVLTGLRPGIPYQVDLFSMFPTVGSPYAPQDTQFTFNGSQTNHFTAAFDTYYDVRETVIANGSGNIVVGFSSPLGSYYGSPADPIDGTPKFQGFAVFELPEPSSVLLIGFSGLLMWRRRIQ